MSRFLKNNLNTFFTLFTFYAVISLLLSEARGLWTGGILPPELPSWKLGCGSRGASTPCHLLPESNQVVNLLLSEAGGIWTGGILPPDLPSVQLGCGSGTLPLHDTCCQILTKLSISCYLNQGDMDWGILPPDLPCFQLGCGSRGASTP